jgi:hypothetical protein
MDSSNPSIFLGIINFAKDFDDELSQHLEKSTVFRGTSKTIQNKLLHCMLNVCRKHMKEISQAKYVAVMGDKATEVSCNVQFVTVFRYLNSEKSIVERFWGFSNPADHKAQSIAKCLFINDLNQVLDNKYERTLKARLRLIFASYFYVRDNC